VETQVSNIFLSSLYKINKKGIPYLVDHPGLLSRVPALRFRFQTTFI